MVPPGETIVRRLKAKTAPALAEVEKKKEGSSARLKAAEAKIAEREFAGIKTEIKAVEGPVTSARNQLMKNYGDLSPEDLVVAAVAKAPGVLAREGLAQDEKSLAGAKKRILQSAAANIIAQLLVFKRASVMAQSIEKLDFAALKELSTKVGKWLSDIRAKSAAAMAGTNAYIQYWESVRSSGELPGGFWHPKLAAYNKKKIGDIVDTIFSVQFEAVKEYFKALDALHGQ